MRWLVCLGLVAAVGCKRPPEAPEGLDASTRYLVKDFFASDEVFQAGIQGFVDWYDGEGEGLLDEGATLQTVDAYTVGDLLPETIAHLPVDDKIVIDPDTGEKEPRDLTRAKGVVSLAEMDCNWKKAEKLLVRPDQDVVFEGDFDGYARTYLSARTAFEGARESLEFDSIKDDLAPFEADFDREAIERTLLMTENEPDPSPVFGANMTPYPMNLDMRHGVYEIDGEDTAALAILTYNISAAWGENGATALLQGFSIEVNIERGPNKTLRMLAVWSEPKGGGIDPDSAIALNAAVNKALAASERLSGICAGDIEI